MTDVKKIVRDYLIRHDYDGLVHVDSECGCGIDDLCITEHCPNAECQPAYAVKCNRCGADMYSTGKNNMDECVQCCD